MSALAKVFVVFNFVMAVSFFGASATLFLTRVDWRDAYIKYKEDTEKKLGELRKKQNELNGRNNDLDRQLGLTRGDLTNSETRREKLTDDLASATGQIKISRDHVAKSQVLQSEQSKHLTAEVDRNRSLEDQLGQANTNREEALGQLGQANEERNSIKLDLDKAQQELHAMRVAVTNINGEFEELQLRYDFLKSRCKGGDIEVIAPPIEARVVAVDAGEKLVVLSVGRDQKVEKGFRFTVYRGSSFVGKVEVFEVYPDLSGARILFTKEGSMVEQGDSASTALN